MNPDDVDDEPFLRSFLQTVSDAGCDTFIIHARKAILEGLSPKENRSVPPLRYDLVAQMKTEFPHLNIILNGGIAEMEDVQAHCKTFEGVMIGRKAYQTPYFLADIEQNIFKNTSILQRETVVQAMIPYIERQQRDFDTPLKSVTRHMLGLFSGQPGAKAWKRHISEHAHKTENASELLNTALSKALEGPKNRDAA
ncbi:MAG: tRNA-dihydrouridine synthase [Pseudomonadota bacterium]